MKGYTVKLDDNREVSVFLTPLNNFMIEAKNGGVTSIMIFSGEALVAVGLIAERLALEAEQEPT